MFKNKFTILRVARPSKSLKKTAQMYIKGLNFEILGEFSDHNGFDGIILGNKNYPYHLELTYCRNSDFWEKPSADNLLVFYIPEMGKWKETNLSLIKAGFKEVKSFNPYWDIHGKTYEDPDGYRLVIQNTDWTK